MSLFHQGIHQRQNLLKQLQKQIQGLQNEMAFVEILAQFWPLPNMSQKMERLEQKLSLLNQQYQFHQTLKVS